VKFKKEVKKNVFQIILLITLFGLTGCSGEKRENFYSNGQIKERGIVKENSNGNFVKDGEWKYWYDNGQLYKKGQYDNGKKVGLWKEWRSDGIKDEEIEYLNDKKHGIYKEWDSSSQLETEGSYVNDKKNGLWQEWHSNGKLRRKGEYKVGLKIGSWKEWYSDGSKEEEEFYNQKGNLNGKRTQWYSDGSKSSEENYLNGKEVKNTYIWSKHNGKRYLAREYFYAKPGIIDTHTSYDPYGNVLSTAENGNGSLTRYYTGNYNGGKDTKGRSYTCYDCTIKESQYIENGKIKSYPVYIYTNGNLREKKIDGSHSMLWDPN